MLVVVLTLATVKAYAEPQEMQTLSGERFEMALDGSELLPIYIERVGTDANITIFDKNLNEIDLITVSGAYMDEGGISSIEYPVDIVFGNIYISRNVFTNDGSWNVLLYTLDDEIKYGSKVYVCTTNGERLFELPRSMYRDETMTPAYVTAGKGQFLTTGFGEKVHYYTKDELYTESERTKTITVWKFDSSSKTVEPTVISRKAIVSPNPLPSGETLKITLPREADDHTFVTITDMNGRQELRERVREGEAQVSISPRFAHGLYIFTIIYGNGETASGKVAAE